MKRPQFGFRLMLLLVTLVATIFGWRAAVEQVRREDRNGERFELQLSVRQSEKTRAAYEELLKSDDEVVRAEATRQVKRYDENAANLKARIDAIGK
jgi:hypothetical protein